MRVSGSIHKETSKGMIRGLNIEQSHVRIEHALGDIMSTLQQREKLKLLSTTYKSFALNISLRFNKVLLYNLI